MDFDYINNAHDSSLLELKLIDGSLDNISLDDKFKLVRLATNKIAHTGVLTISAIDALEVSRGMYRGYLKLDEFNKLLRPSLCSANDIIELLESLEFNILVVRINNYRYYIEASRP